MDSHHTSCHLSVQQRGDVVMTYQPFGMLGQRLQRDTLQQMHAAVAPMHTYNSFYVVIFQRLSQIVGSLIGCASIGIGIR